MRGGRVAMIALPLLVVACGHEVPVAIVESNESVAVTAPPMTSTTEGPERTTTTEVLATTTTAPADRGVLRGDGVGQARFGMSEAEVVATLEAEHGTSLRAEPPANTATPSLNGCTSTGDAIVGFDSGLIVGISEGTFSSWALAGGVAGQTLGTSAGLGWGDTFEDAERLHGDGYRSADLSPLYNWGPPGVRVVATVDDHGPILLAALDGEPMPEWSGTVWLLTAGLDCVPPPIVPPTGGSPIGERFSIRADNETGYPLRATDADGTPTSWLSLFEPCLGVSSCVFRMASDTEADRAQELWIAIRIERVRDDAVWLVTDVVDARAADLVIRSGWCLVAGSDATVPFAAFRLRPDGHPVGVLSVDNASATFVPLDLGTGVTCTTTWDEGSMIELSTDVPAPAAGM